MGLPDSHKQDVKTHREYCLAVPVCEYCFNTSCCRWSVRLPCLSRKADARRAMLDMLLSCWNMTIVVASVCVNPLHNNTPCTSQLLLLPLSLFVVLI